MGSDSTITFLLIYTHIIFYFIWWQNWMIKNFNWNRSCIDLQQSYHARYIAVQKPSVQRLWWCFIHPEEIGSTSSLLHSGSGNDSGIWHICQKPFFHNYLTPLWCPMISVCTYPHLQWWGIAETNWPLHGPQRAGGTINCLLNYWSEEVAADAKKAEGASCTTFLTHFIEW